MSHRPSRPVWLLSALIVLPALPTQAESPLLPTGTPVYAELTEEISSRKRETSAGDVRTARVWQDVVVNGEVVIEQGAELLVQVHHVKKARFLGRRGHIDVEAISVQAVDGTAIPLTGFYTRDGKGRKLVTATLAVAVAWPFAFIRGKNAIISEGTVFEAFVRP